MNIQHLLYEFVKDYTMLDQLEAKVTGLSLDSKKVTKDNLFFAIKGQKHDGRAYLLDAIERGACALVVEQADMAAYPLCLNAPIPVIPILNLQEKISEIAGRYYGDPSHDLTLIGITGTNGKTTSAHSLAAVLNGLGQPCAVIGTLTHALTTPDAITLQAQLATFKAKGIKTVVMEVSSHGLEQYRVQGIQFDSAIFTNLTQDHLDYHGSMQAYATAKQKLFLLPSLQRMILNAEDDFTLALLKRMPAPNRCPTLLYSRQPTLPTSLQHFSNKPSICLSLTTLSKKNSPLTAQGMIAQVATPWGEATLRSRLIGDFNLSNLLGVLAELGFQGVPLPEAVQALGRVSPPPGRMQRFGGAALPVVLVDYAHTPDALYNALQAARGQCARRLWCVFGCGGDRDKLKRSKMGQIAATMADKVVITNDNPRTEDPQNIIMDILEGIASQDRDRIVVEEDRKDAIAYAIHHALAQDVILVAGKGHEDYQQIGTQRRAFSDIACVQAYLGENNNAINSN